MDPFARQECGSSNARRFACLGRQAALALPIRASTARSSRHACASFTWVGLQAAWPGLERQRKPGPGATRRVRWAGVFRSAPAPATPATTAAYLFSTQVPDAHPAFIRMHIFGHADKSITTLLRLLRTFQGRNRAFWPLPRLQRDMTAGDACGIAFALGGVCCEGTVTSKPCGPNAAPARGGM